MARFLWKVASLPTAYDPEKDVSKAIDDVLRSKRDNHPDVVIHSTVRQGRPAVTLVEASKEADLLVVGTHGHGEVSALLLGSVSEDCAHPASCPVVIIRECV
jgi:nucleotide-binding universal stress UspA family protein